MTIVTVTKGQVYKEEIQSPSEGNVYIFDNTVNAVMIHFIPLAGNVSSMGKLEYSIDEEIAVRDGIAEWGNWDWGFITTEATDTIHPPTALRTVIKSGRIKLILKAV